MSIDFGEMDFGETDSAKCPFDEMAFGEMYRNHLDISKIGNVLLTLIIKCCDA
jgi:hypothetical protein